MITLCAATQGAELFFHVFMEVFFFSLSRSLSLRLPFNSLLTFGRMFLNTDIKRKKLFIFVFTSMEGYDSICSSVHH